MKSNKQLQKEGKLYLANDEELHDEFIKCRKLMRAYNATKETKSTKRTEILKKLLGHIGDNCYIEPPFRCDYGLHTSVGDYFYANFDCIFLDVCSITIGNHVFLGPRVSIFTACHPLTGTARNTNLEYGKPVIIGDNVWIGGNAVINPGVNIGSNVVIGSGSVVTKDIPSNVIAAGNPARILRAIDEKDEAFWKEKVEEYFLGRK